MHGLKDAQKLMDVHDELMKLKNVSTPDYNHIRWSNGHELEMIQLLTRNRVFFLN